MNQLTGKVRCIIFDCDGVLVDSERLCCKALVDVFSQYKPHLSFEECVSNFQGGKVADILADTIRRFEIPVAIDDVESSYRTQIKRLFEDELTAIPGVERLLGQLIQMGIDFCVVSNSQKIKIERSLALTGLSERFEGRVFSAFEANSWKPDPDVLLYSAMIMGYAPNECIYIDDTVKGVNTGINAGIKTIHFRSSSFADSCLDSDVTEIRQLSDLLSLLEGMTAS